jgi:hypothetical protein
MLKHKINKKLTDDDIAQYCESVERLLETIHERSTTKKGKKTKEVKEDYLTSDEEMLVLS